MTRVLRDRDRISDYPSELWDFPDRGVHDDTCWGIVCLVNEDYGRTHASPWMCMTKKVFESLSWGAPYCHAVTIHRILS